MIIYDNFSYTIDIAIITITKVDCITTKHKLAFCGNWSIFSSLFTRIIAALATTRGRSFLNSCFNSATVPFNPQGQALPTIYGNHHIAGQGEGINTQSNCAVFCIKAVVI